jgi:hypothetical protein
MNLSYNLGFVISSILPDANDGKLKIRKIVQEFPTQPFAFFQYFIIRTIRQFALSGTWLRSLTSYSYEYFYVLKIDPGYSGNRLIILSTCFEHGARKTKSGGKVEEEWTESGGRVEREWRNIKSLLQQLPMSAPDPVTQHSVFSSEKYDCCQQN